MEVLLAEAPIGVTYFREAPDLDLPRPGVLSFCNAVARVRQGDYPDGLIVAKETIETCVWCPVALGLREPEGDADAAVPRVFDEEKTAVLVRRLDPANPGDGADPDRPDAVVITGNRETMERLVDLLGPDEMLREFQDDLTFSANALFVPEESVPGEEAARNRDRRLKRILALNRLFGSKLVRSRVIMAMVNRMMRWTWVQNMFTKISFKHTNGSTLCLATTGFPYRFGKANIAFADSGSVAWGGVDPESLMMGLPWRLYAEVRPHLRVGVPVG